MKKWLSLCKVVFVKYVVIAFWSCFMLVPGVLAFLDYCFCELIVLQSDGIDARGVLMLSKELAKGHRLKIFSWTLLSFVCALAVSVFVFLLLFVVSQFCFVPKAYYVFFCLFAGLFTGLGLFLPILKKHLKQQFSLAQTEKIRK